MRRSSPCGILGRPGGVAKETDMQRLLRCCAFLSAASLLAPAAFPQGRGGQELFGHYEPVPDWPKPLPDGPDGVKHSGWTWGSVGSVYAESPDRIWIAMRGELPLPQGAAPWTPYSLLNPRRTATGNDDGRSATCEPSETRGWERRYHHVLFVVDGEGNQVQHWGQHDKLFEMPCGRGPHKIKMSPYDPDKHVWVIDDQLHMIYKFTYDGKIVMSLGTKGKRGRDAGKLFDRPTDIAWLPDGTFFISDGYGGTRVAKFDKDGKFIKDWGKAPADPKKPGPNEFNTVHSIAVTADRRLFVVDRGHGRIQIFDEEGKFLDMFATGPEGPTLDYPLGAVVSRPYAHLITADQMLWVTDGGTNRVLKYDLTGKYLYGWGQPGPYPGQFGGPHALTVDQDGNLYIAEVFSGRVQKFQPKPGADPSKLVGQEKRYKASSN
jgi:DNA-binding beta-propeller fold protein YncE